MNAMSKECTVNPTENSVCQALCKMHYEFLHRMDACVDSSNLGIDGCNKIHQLLQEFATKCLDQLIDETPVCMEDVVIKAKLICDYGDIEPDDTTTYAANRLIASIYRDFPDKKEEMNLSAIQTSSSPGLSGVMVTVGVRGDSMEPAFYDGDLVFCERDYEGVPDRCHNKQCVVQVKDGPVYLKILKPAVTPGYYHLQSINKKTEVLPDQQVEWASRVLYVKKG